MRCQPNFVVFVFLLSCLLVDPGGSDVYGHGINGHVHVTAWSMAEINESAVLDLFDDPLVVDAMLFGAAFPDTGNGLDDAEGAYGETVHWEPFIEVFIQHMMENYPPPYETPEIRRKLGFLFGVAAHGLQDEIFDTLFLDQIAAYDGAGQYEADFGTDGFLHVDGHLEHKPAAYAPLDDLVPVLAQAGVEADPRAIETGMDRVKLFVIDFFDGPAMMLNDELRDEIPWTAENYMNPDIPGSLPSEIKPTAAYIEALWARLHARPPVGGRVAYTYPEGSGRSRAVQPGIDAWITLVFGTGAVVGSLNAETVSLVDSNGVAVEMEVDHSRWTGRPDSVTRMLVVKPQTSLQHDALYRVRLNPGVRYVDGSTLDEPWFFEFKTPCTDAMAARCAREDAIAPDAGTTMAIDGGADGAGRHSQSPSNAGSGCQSTHWSGDGGFCLFTLLGLLVMWRRRRLSRVPSGRWQ